jgi:uncharacterized membrane protein
VTTSVTPAPPASRPSGAGWRIAAALIILSVIPLSAGTLRLVQLAGGPAVMPADERFAGVPVALVIHIGGSGIYALVGILQFVPRFRRRHWGWHRRAGRLLAVAGLAVAGSALWLTLAYPAHPGTGSVAFVARLAVGTSMVTFLVLGVAAIRRRDIASHRAFMIRAYALALGAGTQAFTEGLGGTLFGTGVLAADLAKTSAWMINLVVAEWAIRRSGRRRSAPATESRQASTAS